MSRKDFYLVKDIPVMELMLDPQNARIRSGKDQAECISRILRKEDQLIALAKNIAENGLSTVPILIWKDTRGKWVVMDGNRRVTALKLLNNPDLCPIEKPRRQLAAIKAQYAHNIPSSIDCLASDDPEAIVNEILLRHSGALSGAGQLDWTTYWRTAFMLQHHRSDPNRRVGQYLLWAEERGISIDDSFPVTNLVRFINEANLKKLGFKVQDDALAPILHEDVCKQMAIKIINDFGLEQKSVNTVFTPEQQQAYLNEVRQFAGLNPSSAGSDARADKEERGGAGQSDGRQSEGGNTTEGRADSDRRSEESDDRRAEDESDRRNEGQGERRHGDDTSGGAKERGSRPKPPWDRPKLFPRATFPIVLPDDATKVRSVVADLCKLETEKTTLAVAVLLRVLIEMSNAHYRAKNGLKESDGLRGGVLDSARKMHADGKLTVDQFEVIDRRTKSENDMLNINTLQAFVHKSTFHPDRQSLHTFWDDVRWFVIQCWALDA